MDYRQILRDLGAGKVGFPAVVAMFNKGTFTLPQRARDFGELYVQAEQARDDDVPAILNAAKFAKQISPDQYGQLMEIYRQKVTQGPVKAPGATA